MYDAKTNKIIMDGLVEYHEYPAAVIKGEAPTDHETGKYTIVLPYSEKFVVSAHAHGYVASFDTLNYANATEYTEITKDFYLTPIIKGEKVILKHVNFETNSAVLESSSFIELDKVAEFLIENPEVKILIGGHTDNAGFADKNLTLSEARAKSVMDYILSKGVTPDRLESKGYGQTQPIVANDTPENMRTNRRVDFTIMQE
jgi:OOP family OmpA-OmpF porin